MFLFNPNYCIIKSRRLIKMMSIPVVWKGNYFFNVVSWFEWFIVLVSVNNSRLKCRFSTTSVPGWVVAPSVERGKENVTFYATVNLKTAPSKSKTTRSVLVWKNQSPQRSVTRETHVTHLIGSLLHGPPAPPWIWSAVIKSSYSFNATIFSRKQICWSLSRTLLHNIHPLLWIRCVQ